MIEREENGKQGDEKERGVTLDHFIDKNSPCTKTKKQILTIPNPHILGYIKQQFSIIKKKPVQEDEAVMFAKFKEMLANFQVSILFHEILEPIPKFVKFMKVLLKGTKGKVGKEHINMTKKEEVVRSQVLPPKLKDPSKFTIPCNIGEVNILHALCDLGSNINVMPVKTVRELNVGAITLSNMTLSLVDLFVTQPIGILRNMLVHVDRLVFPVDFVVLDTKGTSGGFVILEWLFLEIGKAKIDVETTELILKVNKKKVVFKV